MYLEHVSLIVEDYDAAPASSSWGEPREEPYGRVAVFLDLAGNRWDLLGPGPSVTRPPLARP